MKGSIGLYRISESVRAYAYLILSSHASVSSRIIGNTARALTAQESSGCTRNETTDKKLWLFTSAPIGLTGTENS